MDPSPGAQPAAGPTAREQRAAERAAVAERAAAAERAARQEGAARAEGAGQPPLPQPGPEGGEEGAPSPAARSHQGESSPDPSASEQPLQGLPAAPPRRVPEGLTGDGWSASQRGSDPTAEAAQDAGPAMARARDGHPGPAAGRPARPLFGLRPTFVQRSRPLPRHDPYHAWPQPGAPPQQGPYGGEPHAGYAPPQQGPYGGEPHAGYAPPQQGPYVGEPHAGYAQPQPDPHFPYQWWPRALPPAPWPMWEGQQGPPMPPYGYAPPLFPAPAGLGEDSVGAVGATLRRLEHLLDATMSELRESARERQARRSAHPDGAAPAPQTESGGTHFRTVDSGRADHLASHTGPPPGDSAAAADSAPLQAAPQGSQAAATPPGPSARPYSWRGDDARSPAVAGYDGLGDGARGPAPAVYAEAPHGHPWAGERQREAAARSHAAGMGPRQPPPPPPPRARPVPWAPADWTLPLSFPYEEGPIRTVRPYDPYQSPDAKPLGLTVKPLKLSASGYGVDQQNQLQELRSNIASFATNRTVPLSALSTFVSSNFVGHDSRQAVEVMAYVLADLAYTLPSPMRVSPTALLPTEYADQAADVVVWSLNARMYGDRAPRDAEVLKGLRQGKCTPGSTSVPAHEGPGEYLKRIALMLEQPLVRTHVPVSTVLATIGQGIHPSLKAEWASHATSDRVATASVANSHPALAAALAIVAQRLEHHWVQLPQTAALVHASAPDATAVGDVRTPRQRFSRAPGIAARAALFETAAATGAAPAKQQRVQQILSSRAGAPAPAAPVGGGAQPTAPAGSAGGRGRACWICNDPGHLSRTCPRRAAVNAGVAVDPEGACYVCAGAGHGFADCPRLETFDAMANLVGLDTADDIGALAAAPAADAYDACSDDEDPDAVGCTVAYSDGDGSEAEGEPAAATRDLYNAQHVPVGFAPPPRPSDPLPVAPTPGAVAPAPAPTEALAPAAAPMLEAMLSRATIDLPGAALQQLRPADALALAQSASLVRVAGTDFARLACCGEPAEPSLLASPRAEAAPRRGGRLVRIQAAAAGQLPADGDPEASCRAAASWEGQPPDPGDPACSSGATAAGEEPASDPSCFSCCCFHKAAATERAEAEAEHLPPEEMERQEALQLHVRGPGRGLFFYDTRPGKGVSLRWDTDAGQAHARPVRVMHDDGAGCNLITRECAESIGAVMRPSRRCVVSSMGGRDPVSLEVVADVILAAGTDREAVVHGQPFLLAPKGDLFDVLIGNDVTLHGPLESTLDGQTHVCAYTIPGSTRRAILPMVTWGGRRRHPGAAHAAACGDWDHPDEGPLYALATAADELPSARAAANSGEPAAPLGGGSWQSPSWSTWPLPQPTESSPAGHPPPSSMADSDSEDEPIDADGPSPAPRRPAPAWRQGGQDELTTPPPTEPANGPPPAAVGPPPRSSAGQAGPSSPRMGKQLAAWAGLALLLMCLITFHAPGPQWALAAACAGAAPTWWQWSAAAAARAPSLAAAAGWRALGAAQQGAAMVWAQLHEPRLWEQLASWGGAALVHAHQPHPLQGPPWLAVGLQAAAALLWWRWGAATLWRALPLAGAAAQRALAALRWAASVSPGVAVALATLRGWRSLRALAEAVWWWERGFPYLLRALEPCRAHLVRLHVRWRRHWAAWQDARSKNNAQKRHLWSPRRNRRGEASPPRWWNPRGRPWLIATLAVGAVALAALIAVSVSGVAVSAAPPPAWPPAGPSEGMGPLRFATAATTVSAFLPDGTYLPPPGSNYTKDPDTGWLYGNHRGFNASQQAELHRRVHALRRCFAFELSDLTGYSGPLGDFRIRLTHDNPVHEGPRRLSPMESEVTRQAVADLLAAGFCEPCPVNGKYACNMVVAAKKDSSGEWKSLRCCHDFRRLNAATEREEHGLHHVDDLFQWLGTKQFYTKLDLRSGFYQINIAEQDRNKTAFWCDRTLYRFVRMPFGLKCAPIFFQRVVDSCLAAGNVMDCARGFIDDIIIASDTPEAHIRDVERVLTALAEHGLKVHPDKSVFGAECVEYLGHNVSRFGHTPSEAKVAAITNMPSPTNVSELRAVLGLLSYYRCYCRDFGAIAAPLTELTKQSARWTWGAAQADALAMLKAEICAPGRALRPIDYSRPIFLHTDWSIRGIGAVIGQRDGDGNEYMCACISRSLNAAESRYESCKGELLAVCWAIRQFRPFLHGAPFTVVTDHAALKWLLTNPNLTGQYARWAAIIQEHDFTVEHRAGASHQNADALSRLPQSGAHDPSGARLDDDAAAAATVCGGGRARGLADLAEPTQRAAWDDTAAAEDATALASLHYALATGSGFIDRFAPTHFQLFHGHNGSLLDADEEEPWADEPAAVTARARMHRRAATWVHAAMRPPLGPPPPGGAPVHPLLLAPGKPDAHGVRPVSAIDTHPIGASFFQAAQSGITLYEPFGGLCAGLEMVLRSGVTVRRYLYSDTSAACQRVARHRVAELAARYPRLFSLDAAAGMLSLPQDVAQVGTAELIAAGATDGSQWLVVGGWPCQDLSAAGRGAGLRGSRSGLFFDLLRVVGTLQQLQPQLPPAYVLENTNMHHATGDVQARDFPIICGAVGQPILVDAAQCGSRAHRLRNFWTNLADVTHLAHVFRQAVRRLPNLHVDSILDPGRVSRPVERSDVSTPANPWYVCNKGTPEAPGRRCALPTLMATIGSHNFRQGKSGCIYVAGSSPLRLADPPEPNPDERERALGYRTGCTAAPGLTWQERHAVTGGCMDANALDHLFAISLYLERWNGGAAALREEPPPLLAAAAAAHVEPWGRPAPGELASFAAAAGTAPCPTRLPALAVAAGVDEPTKDIWADERALAYLRTRAVPRDASDAERRRLQRCAERYSWQGDCVYRRLPNGQTLLVPRPERRVALVLEAHEKLGHLGRRRTTALVMTRYWWRTLPRDVDAVVGTCESCARVRASFLQSQPHLNPLPIKGLFYRWGVDLCGPFDKTERGNKYAMICIDHWSKAMVVTPIPDKTAATTAYAFLHHVLARFGGPAEVLTDQGKEWAGEFQRLLADVFVDHRSTSAEHPASNGLAERAVQTLKGALAKYAHDTQSQREWDVHCAWLALGYNCSPQQSTRLSPYHILYGRQPCIPSSVAEVVTEPLSFDDPLAVVADVLTRGAAVRRACPTIDERLAIAQHRDTERYAVVRSGLYVAKPKPLEAGDYVWLRRHNTNSSLQTGVMPPILRVHKVGPEGILTLMGKCGRTLKAHVSHCARCTLAGIDPTLNPSLRPYERELPCEACGDHRGEADMLLCDGCGRGWHNRCLPRCLAAIPPPEEVWICAECSASGVTGGQAEAMRASAGPATRRGEGIVFPDARARRFQAHCAAFDGRVVARPFALPSGRKRLLWGHAEYAGIERRPYYFTITYTDGSQEDVSLAQLLKWVKPQGTAIPAAARAPGGAPGVRPNPRRPRTAAAAAAAPPGPGWGTSLALGMPGPWAATDLVAAEAAANAYHALQVPALPYRPEAVDPLLRAIDVAACLRAVDPFAEHPAVARGLKRAGVNVQVGLRRSPYRHDALTPAFYEGVQRSCPIEAIVSAPWPPLLDLALPLFVAFATRMVCCLVPVSYLCGAPAPRREWLLEAQKAKRLCFVHTPAEAVGSSPAVWLIIFPSAELAATAVRAPGAVSAILE